ncbi:MAG: RDD family protein [Planctomycetota bacterium]
MGKRFAAIFIDGLITGIPLLIVYVVYIFSVFERGFGDPEQFDGTSMSLVFIAGASVVNLLYEGMMLQARGQTLGKMALGIKVVTPDGEDISPGQAWGRALVRVIFNALQYISLVNYLPAFFSQEKKTVHDSVAKTRVVNWRG